MPCLYMIALCVYAQDFDIFGDGEHVQYVLEERMFVMLIGCTSRAGAQEPMQNFAVLSALGSPPSPESYSGFKLRFVQDELTIVEDPGVMSDFGDGCGARSRDRVPSHQACTP